MRSALHARGFTLIELLVVIAIIGMLATLIMVSLAAAKTKAQYTRAVTDIRTLETALELYAATYGDWPTPGNTYLTSTSANDWAQLAPYLQGLIPSMPMPLTPSGGRTNSAVYLYYKGSAHIEYREPVYDPTTGAFLWCVLVDDGYWLDFRMPKTNSITENDNGYDPKGVDFAMGNVSSSTNPAICLGSGPYPI